MKVICQNCGKEFDYNPPAVVRCPRCGYRYGTVVSAPGLPKSERRQAIEYGLKILGIVVGGMNLADLIFKTKFDIHRDQVTKVLTDTEVFTEKDWVCADGDACEFCLDMQANGPYPIDYSMDSHPHCRCSWWPRRTTGEVPAKAYEEEV
jgi:predicted  nucleic acid-binding Zn-ribbon protein